MTSRPDFEYRRMFYLTGDNVVAFIPVGMGDTYDGMVVGFSPSAGKNDFFRSAAEQGSNLVTGDDHCLMRLDAKPVAAGRIAEIFFQKRPHTLDYFRGVRRGGVII